ncbi:type I restriction-modification system subunit M [Selenomonas sp.]|uniref:type I restriction-modification system subunit M n=1 Tax=Selenomonas sp. TaxID=2053611 RepID=UPI0025D59033|nr:class I SAM-dependent DNA methyltransferase [Selenomonas sp.]MCI6085482.1 type I restriction-modification system subunit M [Selenomonas sp.]MDY3296511.1 class I SAM-dependent DNA methyltransferase [Selenomonas sp.]
MSLMTHVKEKADFIWSIADKLTGVYKPHEYGNVILPLTVIRRFDCMLAGTKATVDTAVKETRAAYKINTQMLERRLCQASGCPFYNTSPYTLQTLLDDPDNLAANFRQYLAGFSANVREIIKRFNFDPEITRMDEKGILYIVLQAFTTDKGDFHPNHVSNIEMGYVFEEIIRKFSESSNEDAGQHYTPREVIRLMVNILFMDDDEMLTSPDAIKTLYDPACGTGGMLSVASEYLKKLNASATLIPYGQEINDQTFAICQADTLIKGEDATHIQPGNTLSDDQFAGDTFDYILSNPPFGREWKNEKKAVLDEQKTGFAGRFGAGVPAIGDSQMLFLETVVRKMKPAGSRVAIIHNGSPLFTGDAGSGPSEIRRYLLEHDLIEAIIALPNDIFYNTGIATYIWVLSNRKSVERRGKVQLINANGIYTKLRKSLGSKRVEISDAQIAEISRIYGAFRETEDCKIFPNEAFGYQKITVERPLIGDDGQPVKKRGKLQPDPARRDTENVPLTETIDAYMQREVLPFAPDAWVDEKRTKIGYEIPFTRYFYHYEPPQPAAEIAEDIRKIAKELDGSLDAIFKA